MEPSKGKEVKEEKISVKKMRDELMTYEMKRWQESRGKFVEFDIKTMNKYKVYYDEMTLINPAKDEEGMGVDQLEEPFISLGLAFSREDVKNMIQSVDDDSSGRVEFDEFLRIIHNKSKKKSKGKDNGNIKNFFKQLTTNGFQGLSDFSFKTVMYILRRKNILQTFIGKSEEDKTSGEKTLKAYANMLDSKKKK